jgi:hypothetical protein
MTIMLDTPAQINMFGLLQARGRLHMEIKTGMKFRQSTLAALQRNGLTTARSKWAALVDLNRYIGDAGGPADRMALDLQKWLAEQGKPHAIHLPEHGF